MHQNCKTKTASKVMESVICDQLTRFLEVHKLLPENQHGFRQKRSTMTAHTAMQKEWVQNTEDGLRPGIPTFCNFSLILFFF